jgi:hypothetical protein
VKWSLSALGQFEKCQLKYKFKYIDKLPEPRGAAANRGVDNHKIFEDVMLGKQELPAEYSYYTQMLNDLKTKENFPECKISLTSDWTPTAWDAPDVWFRGILDLKVMEGSAATVVDWKTGKIYPDHDDQKSIYSLAVFSQHPEVQSVRAQHVYIDLGKTREKVFSRDQVPELRSHWNSRASFLARTGPEDMIPNPGYHCRWCNFSAAKGGPCRF